MKCKNSSREGNSVVIQPNSNLFNNSVDAVKFISIGINRILRQGEIFHITLFLHLNFHHTLFGETEYVTTHPMLQISPVTYTIKSAKNIHISYIVTGSSLALWKVSFPHVTRGWVRPLVLIKQSCTEGCSPWPFRLKLHTKLPLKWYEIKMHLHLNSPFY